MNTRPTVTLPVRWPKQKRHHCIFCTLRASRYDLFCEAHWRELTARFDVVATPEEAAYDAEQLTGLFALDLRAAAEAVAR